MQRQFQILPSRLELTAILLTLALAASIALIYVEQILVQVFYLAGIALLAFAECRRLGKEKPFWLGVDTTASKLCLTSDGQPYFYIKYKVYRSRWFAILKLIDRRNNRTVILYPDCFNSLQAYRDCRFLLNRLERDNCDH